ncbi:erythromycin esterase family protein [Nakamurella sp. A5-74]|uniref:Erythromycin esterase family protein n=1 Tax=Nakamurella sp. A5-74 TaxID=3158264 RepID=A0AAU8DRF3_9ACTN
MTTSALVSTTSLAAVASRAQLLALGECTHLDSALALRRNALLPELVAHGFRSVALETDRVAALVVDDYLSGKCDDFEETLERGFSHGFGRMEANRALVRWLRHHNEDADESDRVSFHGIDAAVENLSAPSPLAYLQQAAEYLGHTVDLAEVAGPDEQWSRTEAVTDAASSPGDSAAARELRCWADDAANELIARAPELLTATSSAQWHRTRIVLDAGLGLLRYHRQCARGAEAAVRISGLLATRDALMARNILDIRSLEAPRGPTLVFAHNSHLQRVPATLAMSGMELGWTPAGAIVAQLSLEEQIFVAGSIGRSDGLGLGGPAAGSYEAMLDTWVDPWGIVEVSAMPAAERRNDVSPQQGYVPLDAHLLTDAAAVLHIREGTADRSWI